MNTIYFDLNVPKIIATKLLKPLWPGAVFSPLSPVSYSDLDDIKLPSENHVRVKNTLSLICGTDLHLLYLDAEIGVAPSIIPGNKRIYLGHELCGKVLETGKNVKHLKPGIG